jgi:charged multivesicular body protein 4A/B
LVYRELFLAKKIVDVLQDAKNKKLGGDTRAALFAMKKKKLYESEIEKIQNVKMTLETQIFHVESSVYNAATVSAMSDGAKTMKKIHAEVGVDKIEDILDEIREEAEIGQELNNALGQQLDPVDDDELLAELEELSGTSVATSSASQPVRMPSVPNNKLGGLGWGKQQRKDDDDLKRLEAELAAM